MIDERTKYANMLKTLKNIVSDETCPMNIAADIHQWIDELSYLDVMPIKHGYWEAGYFHDRVCCRCLHPDNDLDDFPHDYCPNCGAKMDKERPY